MDTKPNQSKDEQNKEITNSVSQVASSIAGQALKEAIQAGKTIEIPSLGIVLTPADLKKSKE